MQKGVDNEETFVTGIPVFKDGELEMIISYSSWEITGFDDLRERYNVLQYQNKKLLDEIELMTGRDGGQRYIAQSSRSRDARRLAGVFCDVRLSVLHLWTHRKRQKLSCFHYIRQKGTLYTYDCAPVGEEVIEKELLGEGSMISPLSGIYAVIIKHIDRLSPRLQRAVLEKCAKQALCLWGFLNIQWRSLRVLTSCRRSL